MTRSQEIFPPGLGEETHIDYRLSPPRPGLSVASGQIDETILYQSHEVVIGLKSLFVIIGLSAVVEIGILNNVRGNS